MTKTATQAAEKNPSRRETALTAVKSVPDRLVVLNVNARSICNKSSLLEAVLMEHEPDIVIVTETWLNKSIESADFLPPNYTACRKDRGSRGGGVAIVYKTSMVFVEISSPPELECIVGTTEIGGLHFVIVAVYRPPGTTEEYMLLLNDFLLEKFGNSNCKIIMAGDFNLPHIDFVYYREGQNDRAMSRVLLNLAFSLDLTQIVTHTRTYELGESLLDLVFLSRSVTQSKYWCEVLEGISDHKMVITYVSTTYNRTEKNKTLLVSDFSKADDVGVLDHLEEGYDAFSHFISLNTTSVNDAWEKFKSVVLESIELFVPKRPKKCNRKNPWITRKIVHEKRLLKRMRSKKFFSTRTRHCIDSVSQELKREIIEAKHCYMNETLTNFIKTSPEKFWRYISGPNSGIQFLTNENKYHEQL